MHSLSPPLQKSLKRISPVAIKSQPIPKAQHLSLGSSVAEGRSQFKFLTFKATFKVWSLYRTRSPQSTVFQILQPGI